MPPKKTATTAPKRGLSAYMFFVQEKRAEVKRDHPDATFGEIGKKLGEMWRSLGDEQKSKYEKLAKADKARVAASQ